MQQLIRTACTSALAICACMVLGFGMAHLAQQREDTAKNRRLIQQNNRHAAKREARLRKLEAAASDLAPCDLVGFQFKPEGE